VRYDGETGQLLTGSLLDYAILRADMLPPIRSHLQGTPPTNPLGVKGIGESGTIGAPPTIVHAVLDALVPFGVAHLDMPVTPEAPPASRSASASTSPSTTTPSVRAAESASRCTASTRSSS
jgi:hypothetical protein